MIHIQIFPESYKRKYMIRKRITIHFEEQYEKKNCRPGSKKLFLSFICLFNQYLLGNTVCQVLHQVHTKINNLISGKCGLQQPIYKQMVKEAVVSCQVKDELFGKMLRPYIFSERLSTFSLQLPPHHSPGNGARVGLILFFF